MCVSGVSAVCVRDDLCGSQVSCALGALGALGETSYLR